MDNMLSKALRDFITGPLHQLIVNLGGQNGKEWEEELKKFLRKEPCWTGVLDSVIRVDRSFKPVYPCWVREVIHPDLEGSGPAEYDISDVEQWLHTVQEQGEWAKGGMLHAYLKETDTLKMCLGTRDLEEIQKKGGAFFRKHFKDNIVFGWKGVVRNDKDDRLFAPSLQGCGDEVIMCYRWIDSDYGRQNPALRFKSDLSK